MATNFVTELPGKSVRVQTVNRAEHGTVSLIADDGDGVQQRIATITPEGVLLIHALIPAKAQALGIMVDSENRIQVR